jgi:hypothetical protein
MLLPRTLRNPQAAAASLVQQQRNPHRQEDYSAHRVSLQRHNQYLEVFLAI